MRISGRSVAVVATAFAVGALCAGALALYTGAYNVAATQPHWRLTNWLLHTELHQSVQRQARKIHAPPLDDPAFIERGLAPSPWACCRRRQTSCLPHASGVRPNCTGSCGTA